MLFGTDAGYIEDFDTTRELQLLAAAGLDWRQVLASLTTAPARMFGEADTRGRIARGFAADLVVLGRTRSRAWRRWPTWHTPCAPAS